MPYLNSRGDIVAGIGNGIVSLNLVEISRGGAARFDGDDFLMFQNSANNVVLTDLSGGILASLNRGANEIAANAGTYALWLGGQGLTFASPHTGSTLKAGWGLKDVGRDGTLAICPDRHSGFGLHMIALQEPEGPARRFLNLDVFAVDASVLRFGCAVWRNERGELCAVLNGRETGPLEHASTAFQPRLLEAGDGKFFVTYHTNENPPRFIIQPVDRPFGLVIETGDTFNTDAVVLADGHTAALVWATTEAEWPSQIVSARLDLDSGRLVRAGQDDRILPLVRLSRVDAPAPPPPVTPPPVVVVTPPPVVVTPPTRPTTPPGGTVPSAAPPAYAGVENGFLNQPYAFLLDLLGAKDGELCGKNWRQRMIDTGIPASPGDKSAWPQPFGDPWFGLTQWMSGGGTSPEGRLTLTATAKDGEGWQTANWNYLVDPNAPDDQKRWGWWKARGGEHMPYPATLVSRTGTTPPPATEEPGGGETPSIPPPAPSDVASKLRDLEASVNWCADEFARHTARFEALEAKIAVFDTIAGKVQQAESQMKVAFATLTATATATALNTTKVSAIDKRVKTLETAAKPAAVAKPKAAKKAA